jgi:hypothetical protein
MVRPFVQNLANPRSEFLTQSRGAVFGHMSALLQKQATRPAMTSQTLRRTDALPGRIGGLGSFACDRVKLG